MPAWKTGLMRRLRSCGVSWRAIWLLPHLPSHPARSGIVFPCVRQRPVDKDSGNEKWQPHLKSRFNCICVVLSSVRRSSRTFIFFHHLDKLFCIMSIFHSNCKCSQLFRILRFVWQVINAGEGDTSWFVAEFGNCHHRPKVCIQQQPRCRRLKQTI